MTVATDGGAPELSISRLIPAAPAAIWQAWAAPEMLRRWIAPSPVEVTCCAIELRPGGAFDLTMRLPDGTEMPSRGCILEAAENARIVSTDAMTAGFRPAPKPFMTSIVTLEPEGAGTRYTMRVLHVDEAGRAQHLAMGFETGWGQVLDQLAALATGLEG